MNAFLRHWVRSGKGVGGGGASEVDRKTLSRINEKDLRKQEIGGKRLHKRNDMEIL